jgi:hypothetical protein
MAAIFSLSLTLTGAAETARLIKPSVFVVVFVPSWAVGFGRILPALHVDGVSYRL